MKTKLLHTLVELFVYKDGGPEAMRGSRGLLDSRLFEVGWENLKEGLGDKNFGFPRVFHAKSDEKNKRIVISKIGNDKKEYGYIDVSKLYEEIHYNFVWTAHAPFYAKTATLHKDFSDLRNALDKAAVYYSNAYAVKHSADVFGWKLNLAESATATFVFRLEKDNKYAEISYNPNSIDSQWNIFVYKMVKDEDGDGKRKQRINSRADEHLENILLELRG